MAKLIYASNMSLDGCTEDERGGFDWAPPDDDVFVFITRPPAESCPFTVGIGTVMPSRSR